MANFEPFKCIELFFVPWQVVYKYCDKSFINKPAFFNSVPQLIKKTYRAGTMWFYRFACTIGAQAHISLMTRLLNMGCLFRIIMVIWSWGHRDQLDFTVISLYVGDFNSNTFKSSFSFFFIQAGNSNFRFFLLRVKSFLKERMACLFIKTWFNSILLFKHFFTVTPKSFLLFFVIITVFYIQRFFSIFRSY